MENVRFINVARIVGLFLVLTYHLFKEILPGGFFGVDVFFTFSGYLITSIIIYSFGNKGCFKFIPYIKRRFCRIFPVLFFSIIFTLPLTKLISPDFSVGIDKQVASALGFVTNFFEILTGGTYEAKLLPHLYIHTWSLAVEFQFYLIWGLFCAFLSFLISKLKNRTKKQNLKIFKRILMIFSLIFMVISYCCMQFLSENISGKSVAYFATSSHIYPFFIGTVLGIFAGLSSKNKFFEKINKNFAKFTILAVIVGLIILCCNVNFESNFAYKYGFFIVSSLTAILIFFAKILDKVTAKEQKEPILITHFSKLSYAIYLFHWPMFIIFSNIFSSNLTASILALITSYLLAIFTFYNIEPLFYRSSCEKSQKIHKKFISSVILCLSAICTVISADVFINKKEISELEKEQMVGNFLQNIDELDELISETESSNGRLLSQSFEISSTEELSTDSSQEQFVENSLTEKNNFSKETPKKFNTVKSIDSNSTSTEPSENFNTEKIHASVTIIGDSVALGARKKLSEKIPNSYINTKGSRSLLDGYNLLMDLQNSANLGEYIVIALGTNVCENANLWVERIISDIKPGHKLIFITPFDGHWNESWKSYKTMQYLREIKNNYPFVTIADWAEEISKQPHLLGADKTHIGGNFVAINLFTEKVLEGLQEAESKTAK